MQLCAVRDADARQGIATEAWSPIARGGIAGDQTIGAIAERVGRTPAQVLIRWGIQHELVTIPKSARPERIRENADVFGFALDAEDLAALDALDEGYRTAWDPTDAA